MQDFRKLQVWEKAHALVLDIYRASEKFPKTELYGLTSQIRKSAAAIPENIAEGCGKTSDAEFARYLSIALGSSSELEYELLLAKDLTYLSLEIYQPLQEELTNIRRMLSGLIKKVQIKPSAPKNA